MYSIGIIGSENSHAHAFSKIINASGEYPDMRVTAIYGEEREASERVYAEFGLEKLCDHPFEMLGAVDAVMVTSRDGGKHFEYVKPFLEAGLPAFVDKPFTRDVKQAIELNKLAEAKRCPVMGGSSTRLVDGAQAFRREAQAALAAGELSGGCVWAPVSMFNDYGDFWFYASHLTEIALEIFGGSPYAARAYKTCAGVSASLDYGAFSVALAFNEGNYNYGAAVFAKKVSCANIDISGCYEIEVREFADMLRTGRSPASAKDLCQPVCVMDAILRALETDKPQRIVNPWTGGHV